VKCIPCEREQHGACDGKRYMCTCTSIICASRRHDVSAWLHDELTHKHTDTTLYVTKTRDEVNTHGEERTDN
jgi:hypothetical protein